MTLRCGIVGLPNVGKSTLFNALTCSEAAEAANYPFCTIEPNVGVIDVPDDRLAILSKMASSIEVKSARIEIVDIAGLVEGASKGEGLGNQFLGHIREVDAIIHVLRCFHDDNITHARNKVDPVDDMQIIETELMLADLQSLEKRIPNSEKKAKRDEVEAERLALMKQAMQLLGEGKPASQMVTEDNAKMVKELQLITTKPIIYVCNVDVASVESGNDLATAVKKIHPDATILCAGVEAELIALPADERGLFMEELGIKTSGLERLAVAAYTTLGLQTYFTVGEKETRAWTIPKGCKAPQAAGVIHGDFERGFIKAEVIAYNDYVSNGGESACKSLGKVRQEGKEYVVADGDIIHFKFNV